MLQTDAQQLAEDDRQLQPDISACWWMKPFLVVMD
jgi:hypothetical protein